ncbi:IS630 transposase-related protein [Paludisphaera mucosa]|uniref:IS630 transposase-related protein n=1 Tax=Paludisphaera mucosa TaxID=3030827 RepID=A0ABT6FE65_9BACT|nr:IS630 transposase-related protein [Paludisphaera mucosa]MDG3002427.1 IS630 transposase-related protein [Paludisphaera mucosa]MDG3002867.1 IS630 transposase-related protein [Paludisphaera mucosa]MDG3005834.1 IS630 transposase-related protein [Paludisphaera mucosa]MDG3005907.1 IS630 transposase-related protein [Paludisphaera mucosa]MDG3006614.1 IS630 transposase-related protein [Paludisphaera mucosa]
MKAYSTDLRERVVAACDAGDATREQVAARFSVSVAWIRKLIRQRRETGSIAPKPRGGGRAPAFDADAALRLREAVRADDDATLQQLARAAGVACCSSAVHRALVRLGITRKKSRGGRPSRTAPG